MIWCEYCNNPGEAVAGGIYSSVFDYLQPNINRPDIFEERTTAKSSIYKGQPKSSTAIQVISTLSLVILSAFLFITIVGWAAVLQTFIDSKVINPIIEPVVRARLWYAIIVTIITIIVLGIALWLYFNYKNTHPDLSIGSPK